MARPSAEPHPSEIRPAVGPDAGPVASPSTILVHGVPFGRPIRRGCRVAGMACADRHSSGCPPHGSRCGSPHAGFARTAAGHRRRPPRPRPAGAAADAPEPAASACVGSRSRRKAGGDAREGRSGWLSRTSVGASRSMPLPCPRTSTASPFRPDPPMPHGQDRFGRDASGLRVPPRSSTPSILPSPRPTKSAPIPEPRPVAHPGEARRRGRHGGNASVSALRPTTYVE